MSFMPQVRLRQLLAISCIAALSAFAASKPASGGKEKSLPAGENVLWSDPGDVASFDFVNGIGGEALAPRPPFRFDGEDMSGTQPKIKVIDSSGASWNVKFAHEAPASAFSTRLAAACGYYVEIEYFLVTGHVDGVHGLTRAAKWFDANGNFRGGRFQLRSGSYKFLDGYNWAWDSNPFLGTPQFNGLRILDMLLSNWDAKDAHFFSDEGAKGTSDSNLAVFQDMQADHHRYLFMVSDWGETLGKWSDIPGLRDGWDCPGYTAQTPGFVVRAGGAGVQFGFRGTNKSTVSKGIRVSDVQWLMPYLGRVTDDQIRQGLTTSGATPDQVGCFWRALRDRIEQLRRVAMQ